jgi:hypothetical protein
MNTIADIPYPLRHVVCKKYSQIICDQNLCYLGILLSNSIPTLKYLKINWYYVSFTGKSVILQIVSLTLAGGLTGAVVCRREVQPDEDAGGGALQGQPRGGALRHGRQHGLHHRRSCQGPVLLAFSNYVILP